MDIWVREITGKIRSSTMKCVKRRRRKERERRRRENGREEGKQSGNGAARVCLQIESKRRMHRTDTADRDAETKKEAALKKKGKKKKW